MSNGRREEAEELGDTGVTRPGVSSGVSLECHQSEIKSSTERHFVFLDKYQVPHLILNTVPSGGIMDVCLV